MTIFEHLRWLLSALRRPWHMPTWLGVSEHLDKVRVVDGVPVVPVGWLGGFRDPMVRVYFVEPFDGGHAWTCWDVPLSAVRVPQVSDMEACERFVRWALSPRHDGHPRLFSCHLHSESIAKAVGW